MTMITLEPLLCEIMIKIVNGYLRMNDSKANVGEQIA